MIKKLLCKVFGHSLIEVKKLSQWSDKLYCKRCERFFAINYHARVLLPYNLVKGLYDPKTVREDVR